MTATWSPENQIATILDEIGCVPSNFSEITDRCSNSRMISALKGTNDFSREDAEYYLSFARQMKALAEEAQVPIDWRKTQNIKEILAARKTAIRPIPFAVIFVGPLLFKRVSSGRIETTASYQDCAAFKDPMVASAAAKILGNISNESLRVTQITNERRSADSISDQLADLGFAQ